MVPELAIRLFHRKAVSQGTHEVPFLVGYASSKSRFSAKYLTDSGLVYTCHVISHFPMFSHQSGKGFNYRCLQWAIFAKNAWIASRIYFVRVAFRKMSHWFRPCTSNKRISQLLMKECLNYYSDGKFTSKIKSANDSTLLRENNERSCFVHWETKKSPFSICPMGKKVLSDFCENPQLTFLQRGPFTCNNKNKIVVNKKKNSFSRHKLSL